MGLEMVLETKDLRLADPRPLKCLDCGEHSVSMMVEQVELGCLQAIRIKTHIGWTLQQNTVAEQGRDDFEIICDRNRAHDMMIGMQCRGRSLSLIAVNHVR